MKNIKLGHLLQYKESHLGKFHPDIPRWPNDVYDVLPRRYTSLGKLAKYTLLVTKIKLVYDLEDSRYNRNYIHCLIGSPLVSKEIQEVRHGWLDFEWVEPITEFLTYEEDELIIVKNMFFQQKKKRENKRKKNNAVKY